MLTALLLTVAAALGADGGTCCDCAGDMTGDGTVDGADLATLLGAWGTPGSSGLHCEDVNADGTVDGADLGSLLGLWGRCVRPSAGPCTSCNAKNDCCDMADTPGCSDLACCAAVCAVDPHCCLVVWDYPCRIDASVLCPDLCPGSRECGTTAHDCYTIGPAGCSDDSCCDLVCAIRDRCCWTQWDSLCVELAELFCNGGCGFACDGRPEAEPCGTQLNGGCFVAPAGVSTCCYASGGVDCDDIGCLNAVCGIDPFCCMVAWDHICADEAFRLCPRLCAIGSLGCCVPEAPEGCTDAACEAAVCAIDPSCCTGAWDDACADAAIELCPTICGSVQIFVEPIECGETVCGKLAYVYVAPFTEDDVDQFRLDVSGGGPLTRVTVTLSAELDTQVSLSPSDCDAAFLNWGHTGLCDSVTIEYCVTPGAYDLVVRSYSNSHVFATNPLCAGPGRYSLTVECSECDGAAICCIGHDDPGCPDESCTGAVCLVDRSCCAVSWDLSCVYLATGLCTACGGPGPNADCCVQHYYPGCGDDACESFICAMDPFCCEIIWDIGCSEAAAVHCTICGGGFPGSDCCGGNGGAGCSDPACEAAVCVLDDWCCEVLWDYGCANAAETVCPQCAGWP